MKYTVYIIVFLASIEVCFLSCKKESIEPVETNQELCVPNECSDEYYEIDSVLKEFFNYEDSVKNVQITNGIDTVEQWSYIHLRESNSTIECSDGCANVYSSFESYTETVFSKIQDVPSLNPVSTSVGVWNDRDSNSILYVSESHYDLNIPPLPESTQLSISFNDINNYYIGDYNIYTLSYTDVYKVSLNGVDIYFNRTLGVLNSYHQDGYFLIP